MAEGIVKSGFGVHFIKNNWVQEDWDRYQFNLNQKISIQFKCGAEHRMFNRDEKKFINKLEEENQKIRERYGAEGNSLAETDKTKLTPFYKEVFEEYENADFPLALLGKFGGWLSFKDKKELYEYYLNQSKLEKEEAYKKKKEEKSNEG